MPGHFADSETFTGRLDHPAKRVHLASTVRLEMQFTLLIGMNCYASDISSYEYGSLVLILHEQTKYQRNTVPSGCGARASYKTMFPEISAL